MVAEEAEEETGEDEGFGEAVGRAVALEVDVRGGNEDEEEGGERGYLG